MTRRREDKVNEAILAVRSFALLLFVAMILVVVVVVAADLISGWAAG